MTVIAVGNVPVVGAADLPEGYRAAEKVGRSTAGAIQLYYDGELYWFAKVKLMIYGGKYWAPGWLIKLKAGGSK